LLVIAHFLGCILQEDGPKDRWALGPLRDSVGQNLGVNVIVNDINLSLKTTNRPILLLYCSICKMFAKHAFLNQQMSVHGNFSDQIYLKVSLLSCTV